MANTTNGFIKVSRKITDWKWFRTPGMLEFWIRLLLKAGWKDDEGVERGSLITSVSELAKESMISERQARTFLSRLSKTGEITTEIVRCSTGTATRMGTRSRTRITICKYESYQSLPREVGRKVCQDVRQDIRQEVDTPPYGPSSSSPTPSSITPPISPSLFEEEEKERDTAVSPKKPEIDYGYVLKLWNGSMGGKVPKIKGISDDRKEKIRLRVAEMGGWDDAKKIMQECFVKINESEFCNGENDNKWVATFDWFFRNEKYWIRVSEGNYDNRQRKTQLDILKENITKAHEYYGRQYGYGGTSAYGNPAGGGQDGPDEQ